MRGSDRSRIRGLRIRAGEAMLGSVRISRNSSIDAERPRRCGAGGGVAKPLAPAAAASVLCRRVLWESVSPCLGQGRDESRAVGTAMWYGVPTHVPPFSVSTAV